MSRIIFVPDTNFFIDYPNFVQFFDPARALVHLDIVYPVLFELDGIRKDKNHTDDSRKKRGENAYNAFKIISKLQDTPNEAIELEIYRASGIASFDPSKRENDTSIVDHVIQLATNEHPEDSIVFLTSDKGIPTVLFKDEKKRRGLKNVTIEAPDKVWHKLSSYAQPAANVEHISIRAKPTVVDGERGIEMYLDFQIADMKGQKAKLIVEFAQGVHFTSTLNVTKVLHVERRYNIFIPYTRLGLIPRRHGMDHAKFSVSIWDNDMSALLAKVDEYCLDLALGTHILAKHT